MLGSMLILVFAVRLKWLGPEGPQAAGFVQGLITNTYLSAAEYDLLASLTGDVLSKTRRLHPGCRRQ